jgi:tRNA pseudouridine38-40 synthase
VIGNGSGARRLRATVEYEGSRFAGWQVQPGRRTVQGEIESALGRLLGESVRVVAAGRTDAGVHAAGQEVAFPAGDRWSPAELGRALDALLPADVRVTSLCETDPAFHPRFSATGRRYEYYVGATEDARSPLRAGRTWPLPAPAPLELLREAARPLLGERSFEALSRSGQPERGTRCTVERAEWIDTPMGDLRFTIVADRFLHHMVRYLVATMVEIATGRRDAEDLRRLLSGRGSARAPRPAPAEGLYLTGVRYREGWNRPAGVPGLWPIPVSRAHA